MIKTVLYSLFIKCFGLVPVLLLIGLAVCFLLLGVRARLNIFDLRLL